MAIWGIGKYLLIERVWKLKNQTSTGEKMQRENSFWCSIWNGDDWGHLAEFGWTIWWTDLSSFNRRVKEINGLVKQRIAERIIERIVWTLIFETGSTPRANAWWLNQARSHGGLWGLTPKNQNTPQNFTDNNVFRNVQIGMLVLCLWYFRLRPWNALRCEERAPIFHNFRPK